MVGFMKETEPLIAVQDNLDVQVAEETKIAARKKLEPLAAEEHRLIRLVTGREDIYTDEELEDARRRLSVKKGTTNLWFLEEAEEARNEVKKAEFEYQSAVIPAKEKLIKAGTAKIDALTVEILEALPPVLELVMEIHRVQQQMSEGGARPPQHPYPSLLPGQLVSYQMDLARQRLAQ